jgi:hypothetical protein
VLGGDANAVVATEDQNAAVPEAGLQPGPDTTQADALVKEQAKTAAAEARLKAIQKAQAKAAQLAAKGGATTATAKTTTAAAQTNTVSADSGAGVSKAKLAQFYSIVDDARSMAKQVMRSSNSQNAALAKSYDANLKTLRDSMRGINSEREADRLIAQAKQTRAYVVFLSRQP